MSELPPKSKQLDLSEDLKNRMPRPLLPTVITFFMLMDDMWQEAQKDGFLPPPTEIFHKFLLRITYFFHFKKIFQNSS